jgi:flagellar hook-associated protein 1 FlgK
MDDTSSPLNTNYGYVGKAVVVKGTTQPLEITNGELGGMLKARDTDISGYLDKLSTISQFLLTDFNAMHASGYGADNSTGNNFFGTSGVDYTPDPPNTDWSSATPKGDWLQALTVNKDLFDATNGLAKIAAKTLPSTGTDTQGNASGDNAVNLGNLLKLDSSSLLGNASLDSYYSTVIGQLGVDTQNAQRLTDNQTTLVNQIRNWRESVSGVNMDEEMTNMIRFQQGYNAAARVVTTVDEMLDKLINSTGVVGR